MRTKLNLAAATVLVVAAAMSFSAATPHPVAQAAPVDAAHPYEFVTGSFEAKKDAGISFLISNPNPGVNASVVIQLFTATTQVGSNFTVNVQALNTLTAILFATSTGLHFAKLSSSLENVVIQYRHTDAASVVHFVDAGHVRAIPPKVVGLFVPVNPFRLCDTRDGQGTACQGSSLGASGELDVLAAGVGGIPVTATSLVMSVQATGGTATSYLTLYPDLTVRPSISQVTFGAGQTVTTSVTVKLGTNGRFTVFNKFGTVDVLADVAGYYV
jgi:hypothetical protein